MGRCATLYDMGRQKARTKMKFHLLTQDFVSQISRTCLFVAALVFANVMSGNVVAQHSSQVDEIASYIKFGEFSKALEVADRLPGDSADEQIALIATAQLRSGADTAAVNALNRISSDMVRFKALSQQGLLGRPIGGNFAPGIGAGFGGAGFGPGGNGGGNAFDGFQGGVTQADFQPLMNLIRNTISPDDWQDTNGDGTLNAYPAGVFVDSEGALQKLKIDSKRSLKKLAANSRFSNEAFSSGTTQLRKISLQRLEKQAQLLAAQGKSIPDEMHYLGGLYEIKYLMLLPETNDIVIAGPAGPWKLDADGHAVNAETGAPLLQLDDLVVCLRNSQANARGNNGKFGCSITPRKENLAATHEFISTSKLTGGAWRTALRESLGRQDIEVFGIDAATHAGMVLVEADYRMKLVAMGLEPTIPEIPSYLNRLNIGPDGKPPAFDVARWWFTMNYDSVISDEDRRVFELNGTGVKVLSETEFIDQQGERIHTGQSNGPTAAFASDFTEHFGKIANEYPIYRRLKNLFDLSIVSTLIRSQGIDRRANWNMTYFGNHPEYGGFVYQPPTMAAPTEVDSVMNHRVIRQRKKSSTVKHTLVGVSGGITFDAVAVLNERASVAEDPAKMMKNLQQANADSDSDRWWWD